jgi:hypothetical protein
MVAGAHAYKFFRDVAKSDSVWTVGTSNGPITVESNGVQVQPMFSSRTRAEKMIATVPGYSHLVVLGIDWSEFERLWLKVLTERGILIGLNWSGPNATGYKMPVNLVAESVRAARNEAA